MRASTYTLHPNGRCVAWSAPKAISQQPRRIMQQSAEAIAVLRALNTAIDGEPVGSCRTLFVFNPPVAA